MKAVAALLVCLAISACQSTRPAEDETIRAVTPQEAVAINDLNAAGMRPLALAPRDTLDILALSGGGADGAFGAGVLKGWSETGGRPVFDTVTGVSAGALMAVYAFLGSDYDARLYELFVRISADRVFTKRGLRGLLSDSLYSNDPLKRMIEEEVTPQVVEAVAREHRRGRRLYVGTTNLDADEFVVWDMGALAAGEGGGRFDKVQTFQKVLRASAALPVLFPPVYIKPTRGIQLRQAHVDGGVKSPLVVSDFLFERPARKRRLWIIVNDQLKLEEPNAPVRANLLSIATKSVNGLTGALTQQAVYRAYVRARNTRTSFRLTAIPDDEPPLFDPLSFDADYLRRIYALGRRRAREPDFWWREPPTVKRFDRIAN